MAEQETKLKYQKNKAAFDDWCGMERTNSANWQRWGAASMALNLFLGSGLIYVATLPKTVMIPFMVDSRTGVVTMGSPNAPRKMADVTWNGIKHTAFTQFVEYWRVVTSDPALQKQYWDAAPHFVGRGSQANHVLDTTRAAHNPAKLAKSEIISVKILSDSPLTNDSYQMTWQETTSLPTGETKSSATWQAVFVYAVSGPPENHSVAIDNPFGIFVTEIHLTKIRSTEEQ